MSRLCNRLPNLGRRCGHVSAGRSILFIRTPGSRVSPQTCWPAPEKLRGIRDAKRQRYVTAKIAVEWARQSSSIVQRARRLGDVRRFALYLHAEDERHEIPPLIFGKESRPRPTPYILSDEQICRIIQLAAQSGYRTLRRQTYSTLFALLACTGLRVSEAIRLRYDDITPDGLVD